MLLSLKTSSGKILEWNSTQLFVVNVSTLCYFNAFRDIIWISIRTYSIRTMTRQQGAILWDFSDHYCNQWDNWKYFVPNSAAIYNLTTYEKNMTKTSRYISLAIKTVLAQLINSILIPVIVDVDYLENIYLGNGLVQDVYYMAINAILPPALTLINSTYLISIIKAWYNKSPCKLYFM